eukprot:XP_014060241.1 PREDICTED: tyrosine-protein phosphatase non-receptor type 23-like [Salmo salar]
MKGDHLFSNLRNATFYQRVYLLGGEELLVLQSTVGHPALGDSFHQITDFNDLPTSLFACNVDQSVFEDQQGKSTPFAFLLNVDILPEAFSSRTLCFTVSCCCLCVLGSIGLLCPFLEQRSCEQSRGTVLVRSFYPSKQSHFQPQHQLHPLTKPRPSSSPNTSSILLPSPVPAQAPTPALSSYPAPSQLKPQHQLYPLTQPHPSSSPNTSSILLPSPVPAQAPTPAPSSYPAPSQLKSQLQLHPLPQPHLQLQPQPQPQQPQTQPQSPPCSKPQPQQPHTQPPAPAPACVSQRRDISWSATPLL